MTTLVAIDGVLRAATGNPIREGKTLLEGLKRIGPVVLLANKSIAEAEHWLRTNNIIYDNLLGKEVAEDETSNELRRRQVALERSRGRIDFFVDGDPSNVAWAVSEGICSLLFAHPQFAAPVSRRDSNKGRRSWDDIQAEIDRRQKVALEVTTQEDVDAGL